MNVIIGTAGHIDHGKTALVKALTGVDADRLPEEKRRGITVDLGFAEMTVGGLHFGFVDVPGHERFIKNMLAGASGVDIALLVVAADEGVMPQTREHFAICRLLGISKGIVALTKCDLVDDETQDLAGLEIAELVGDSFLEDAPVIAVSSLTGNGISALTESLVQVAGTIGKVEDDLVTRLPIDRSFSVKGFGAVVTGTLASGHIADGQDMELMPAEKRLRVRGLQTHGQKVAGASRGQRVALNLGGTDHSQIARGMTLVEAGSLRPTQIIDTQVEMLTNAARPVRTRQRIRIHIGTTEALARVQVLNEKTEIDPGSSDLVQVRLESPVIVVPGERFIIRSYSPMATIGGGVVIDPQATRHRRKDLPSVRQDLQELLAAGDDHFRKVVAVIKRLGIAGSTLADLQHRTGLKLEVLRKVTEAAVASGLVAQAGNMYLDGQHMTILASKLENLLSNFHKREPLAKGLSREAARDAVFRHAPEELHQAVIGSLSAAGKIIFDKDVVRLAAHTTELTPSQTALRDDILARLQKAGLEVPKIDQLFGDLASDLSHSTKDAKKILQILLDSGEILKVTEEYYFSADPVNELIANIRQHASVSGDAVIDVPKFKEIAGISRKYAIPLLEYFDRQHITARAGDRRVILDA
jgi:selenocysteine-specific elongation factor